MVVAEKAEAEHERAGQDEADRRQKSLVQRDIPSASDAKNDDPALEPQRLPEQQAGDISPRPHITL